MNTPLAPTRTEVADHYGHLPEDLPVVEHMTIPGFMRQLNYRWHMMDIERFGQKVGRIAETMHLAYAPAIDANLGVLRAFPVPMMRRVYEQLAPAFGWPELPPWRTAVVAEPEPAAETKEGPSAELELRETVLTYLEMVAGTAKDLQLRKCAQRMLSNVMRECQAIRRALEPEVQAPAPGTGLATVEGGMRAG